MLENYEDVITVEELAKIMRIGKSTAYSMLKNKIIRSIQIGARYVILKQDLLNFLASENTI